MSQAQKKTTTISDLQQWKPSDVTNIQAILQRQYRVMGKGGDPRKMLGTADFSDDFNNFYSATEDISRSSGSGSQSSSQNLLELHFLAERRLGVGNALTQGFAEDALFNWFNPKKVDTKNTHVTIPGFNKWVTDTDF